MCIYQINDFKQFDLPLIFYVETLVDLRILCLSLFLCLTVLGSFKTSFARLRNARKHD